MRGKTPYLSSQDVTAGTRTPLLGSLPWQRIIQASIDPFPIIGFYLYHVISADQSNNWTSSGIWSCKNLLLILHAFHIYSLWLKHQTNYIYHNYIWWQKELILFQIYPIYTERALNTFIQVVWFPQLFPLLLTTVLMRWRVSLRVYTMY